MIKKRAVRIFVFLLSVILTGGIYSYAHRTSTPLEISVSAVSVPYKMTDTYKKGRFYKNLAALELSGNEERDVLAIAMSQVGYHEGSSDSDMHGESTAGSRDFVEYNVLSGKWDNNQGNGESYGYYWCASFVNWCLRMAGVDESDSGSEISCQRWYNDAKELNIFRAKSGYIPSSGDIIFFRDSGSTVASTHMGLVRSCNGKFVYTVEGNTSGGNEYSSDGEYVAFKKHDISSRYIVGYAAPRYDRGSLASAVDYSGGFFSLGQYISDGEIDVFSDKDLKRSSGRTIDRSSLFSVTGISDRAFSVEYGGRVGYISAEAGAVQLTTSEEIYVTRYIDESGNPILLPQYRRGGEEKPIYKNKLWREGSGFVGWRFESDEDKLIYPGERLVGAYCDVVLVAVFDDNYYTVTFKSEDGAIIDQRQGYYGSEYSVPTPNVLGGHVFAGWDQKPDGVIRGDAVYTAITVPSDGLSPVGAETSTVQDGASSCSSSISGASLTVTALLAMGAALVMRKRKK